jgi:cation-transporting ATPase E
VISVACFVSYLLAYDGVLSDQADKTQASTAAPIIVMSVLSALMSVVPLTQRIFLLDPSNTRYTLVAFVCAGVGTVLVELTWWVGGWLTGEPRRIFADSDRTSEDVPA